MHVVLAVTRIAIRRRHDLRHIPGRMAGVAIQAPVRAGQRVFCLGVVVIAPSLPAKGIVTEPAIRPQATFVMRVAVATRTIQRRVLELGRPMTAFATYRGMTSDQGKPGEVVIERARLAPGDLRVALLALGAELSLVPVILAVTGDAGGRQLVAI